MAACAAAISASPPRPFRCCAVMRMAAGIDNRFGALLSAVDQAGRRPGGLLSHDLVVRLDGDL